MELRKTRYSFFIGLFIACSILPAIAQNNAKRLFHIERNKNKNIVCYDLNIVDGKISGKSPVHIYWVLYPEQQKKELSFIENKFAYGAKCEVVSPNTVSIRMNALKEAEITVSYDEKTKTVVSIAKVNGKSLKLEKISIIAKAPRYTSVERVDIHGVSLTTGEKTVESVKG